MNPQKRKTLPKTRLASRMTPVLLSVALATAPAAGYVSSQLSAAIVQSRPQNSPSSGFGAKLSVLHYPLWDMRLGGTLAIRHFAQSDATFASLAGTAELYLPISPRVTVTAAPHLGLALADSRADAVFGGNVSVKYSLSHLFQVGAHATYDRYPVTNNSIYGGGVLVEVRFGYHDADNDRVEDYRDRCPSTPYGAAVDDDGCALDVDADGVFDSYDRCPRTPFAALVDEFGCPTDTDGDGVFDGVDRCDETPAGILVDTLGCARDDDRDGVPDYADSCLATPFGADVDKLGCPIDSDEDGIPNGIDLCARTPTGFDVDRFGCPTVATVHGVIVYNLFNETLSLTAAAMNTLNRVATRVRAYPDRVTKVYIYTDSEGSPKYNVNRAARVGVNMQNFLFEQGVDTTMVRIILRGEEQQLVPGSSELAKERNRRAEFFVEPVVEGTKLK